MSLADAAGIMNIRVLNVGIIVLILTIVQITPIKLNPWSWLKDFFSMPSKLNKIEKDVEQNIIEESRIRIIRFACDIRRGEEFDEESYSMIMEDIDVYTNYCRVHPNFRNGKCKMAIKLITEQYEVKRKGRAFLT